MQQEKSAAIQPEPPVQPEQPIQTDTVSLKNLVLSEFNAMLTRDKTYKVSEYYTSNANLEIPAVNSEDTYAFDGGIADGWVSSKEPCIEYHYNIRTFQSQQNIMFEFVDFSISPTTFTVEDYKTDEYFILRSGDEFTKYEVMNKE